MGEPGVLQFDLVHRFEVAGGKVLNSPTLLLGAPLPGRLLVAANYGTNSPVAGGPNELELFARWAPLSAARGGPFDASLTAAYNDAAHSVDGELTLGLPLGRLKLLGVARGFSHAYGRADTRWALGGGATLRLLDWLSLAGDATSLTNRGDDERVAWSVGIQARIPTTPHTISLQATNAWTTTLEGASRGEGGQTLHGFEFTVPITLSRWFGGGSPAPPPESAAEARGPGAVEVTMTDRLRYRPATLRIRAGQTVRWRNTTELIHTVTDVPGRAQDPDDQALPDGARPFSSGELRPGESYEHTFDVAGTYRYFCVPHEAAGMVGTVIVEAAGPGGA
ncbi:MAG TPA: plastocyanin/azurin family copper-binding protein [Gemmatimonadota bacterium]|nr:plastocyanin/azurin family copper-binding protein [Gemmatimonadota bacterium]